MSMDQRIFVAIAAYREPELRLTIESCISNAAHPDRLTFGVCLQHDAAGVPEVHADCLDGLEANLRLLSHDWRESKGGCWARHRVQGLYDDEEYTLQIDAHSRMEPKWDVDLVDMFTSFPGEKPLITGFPPLYFRPNGIDQIPTADRSDVPVTFVKEWRPDGSMWHPSEIRDCAGGPPRPTRFLSGAFVFTSGQWNVEVRQDPDHLYAGEEFALAVRSFTCGYDLYNPAKVVVWHRGHPEPNPKFIHEGAPAEVRRRQQVALKRLRVLLRGDRDRVLAPYSVGAERTVDQFSEWSGLDCRTFTATDSAIEGRPPELSADH